MLALPFLRSTWSLYTVPRESEASRNWAPPFRRTCDPADWVSNVLPLKTVAFPAVAELSMKMLPWEIATPIPGVAADISPTLDKITETSTAFELRSSIYPPVRKGFTSIMRWNREPGQVFRYQKIQY